MPGLGIVPELSRDSLGFFVRQRQIFGDYVTLPFGKGLSVLISSPQGVKQVLQDHAGQYMKGRGHQLLRDLLGQGLLTAEGRLLAEAAAAGATGLWPRPPGGAGRRAWKPPPRALLLPRLEAASRSGEPLDLSSAMMEVALGIVTRALFGASLRQDEFRTVERAMPPVLQRVIRRSRSPFAREFPGPVRFRGLRGERQLKGVVDQLIAERRASVQASGGRSVR